MTLSKRFSIFKIRGADFGEGRNGRGKQRIHGADRRFSSQESEKEPEEQTTAKTDQRPEPDRPAAEAAAGSADTGSPFPKIDFATFIFSLNSSALVHLGVIEEPGTGQKVKNLPLAKQTIDILGVLEEKTRGNLTDDEDNLLRNILHDLRIMYVREKG